MKNCTPARHKVSKVTESEFWSSHQLALTFETYSTFNRTQTAGGHTLR